MSVLGASLRPIAGSCGRNLLPATRKASRVSSYVRQLSTTRPRSQDVIKPSNKEDELLAKPKAKEDELLVKLSPSLAQIIEDSISATGPMPVARYMQLCLTHPTLGYYSQGDVFGQKGDFITSPEISQIFGELVAIWLLTRWMAAGSPSKCRIIELGPGRGTLMDDVLRTLTSLGKMPIESVHLVEASMNMRDVQKEKLAGRVESMGAKLHWENHIDTVEESDAFTMTIAHEFFDALPIHVLQRTDDGFREVRVAKNPSYLPAANNSRFIFAVDRESSLLSNLLPAASTRYSSLPVGSRMEISPDSSHIVRSIGKLMEKGGGVGLVVDYGGDRSFSNSFRAFRKHKIVDVFDQPGSSDLTANVDFAYLKESLKGVAVPFGPIPQSKFLLSMGLEPRLAKLMSSAPDEETKERIRHGAKRLIDTTGMGSQYQVMGFGAGPAAEGDVYPFPVTPTPTPSTATSSSNANSSTTSHKA